MSNDTNTNLPALLKRAAVAVLEDTPRYKCRIQVKSASSNNLYLVSYDQAENAGYWVCSCRGCISTGQCKHLTALGLKGRKFGKTPLNITEK
jgi:hypothetical protein